MVGLALGCRSVGEGWDWEELGERSWEKEVDGGLGERAPRGPVLSSALEVELSVMWGCVSHPVTCFATPVPGFVVGHAGLLQALAMLLVAYFILVLTVLSVCAIATNGAVRGGGAYCILQC